MKKETILQEAQRIVYGGRAASHGDFKENFNVAAQLFNAWTGLQITVEQAVQMLICLKMARQKAKPKNRDHGVDVCGYFELLSRLYSDTRRPSYIDGRCKVPFYWRLRRTQHKKTRKALD